MIDNKMRGEIFSEVRDKYLQEYIPKLETKVAKRNDRNLDGLENSIFQGLEDFYSVEGKENEIENWSVEKYKRKVDWYVKRGVFFYINEPLAYSVVRTFKNLKLPEDEMVSAAKTGFILAFNTFDESKGFQFSTYAWRIISNEIIAADKKRKKAFLVKQNAREILAKDDLFITKIVKSKGARKVLVKSKPVELFDVYTVDFSSSEVIYEFLYHLPKYVKEGATINRGQLLGSTAGIETEVASLDLFSEGDDNREPIVTNTLTKIKEVDIRADIKITKDETVDTLYDAISSLTKQEQIIISKRFLAHKKVNRVEISKELGISVYTASKIEKAAMSKLKEFLQEKDISLEDIKE